MSKIGRIIRLLIYPPIVLLLLLNFVLTCVGGFLVFAFLPFILIWNIGSADAFTCNHLPSKQTCQHESWRLFGLSYQQEEWQIKEARAIIEDVATGGTAYSLSLATTKGEVKLPDYWSDKQELDRDVDRFNQLLKVSSQAKFHLWRGYGWFHNIVLFFFAAGFAIPCFMIWFLLFHLFSDLLRAIFRFFRAIVTLS